jgi:amino acid transporter
VIEQTPKVAARKSIFDLLFGRPLSSDEDAAEQVGPAAGIGIFGLDALSSAAYGPEAALTLLIPLGIAGISYIVPISASIIVLMGIVYFSYRQTITAYPGGGGSYTVAGENLGVYAGLLAGAALMIDYVLTVAVGISAGVGALVSALPELQSHTLALCLVILFLLTLVNLRGVRETGFIFLIPTYLFVVSMVGVIGIGLFKVFTHGGQPIPIIAPAKLPLPVEAISIWLLLKVFASGCTAMTGVEAVSNGVQAFREPKTKSARGTLTIIIAILAVLLSGIAYLVRAYSIGATAPGLPGYQSVLSQLTLAVVGQNLFYWITISSILLVLSLSANTAFADFPRLCRVIAEKGYLPYPLTLRGRRLVFSYGVYALALLSGLLLIIFKGVTDRLIPLYAVGAFLAFTLSQAGMVVHWKKKGGRGSGGSMFINGLGAAATGITVCVVIAAKFIEGAWITVLLIPTLIYLMYRVRKHYGKISNVTACTIPVDLRKIEPPLVVLPIQRWSRVAENALRFAYTISDDIWALHIVNDGEKGDEGKDELMNVWSQYIEQPAKRAGLKLPELVVMKSPYRLVLTPILDYVMELGRRYPDRQVAVLIPELVERWWWYYLLHNQRATALKLMLYLKGNRRIVVINVPWYLSS